MPWPLDIDTGSCEPVMPWPLEIDSIQFYLHVHTTQLFQLSLIKYFNNHSKGQGPTIMPSLILKYQFLGSNKFQFIVFPFLLWNYNLSIINRCKSINSLFIKSNPY